MTDESLAVYQLVLPDPSTNRVFRRFDNVWPDSEIPWSRLYADRRIGDRWTPPRLVAERNDLRTHYYDFSFGGKSAAVFSAAAAKLIRPFLHDQAELLAVSLCDGAEPRAARAEGYILHCLRQVCPQSGTVFEKVGRIVIGVESLVIPNDESLATAVFCLAPSVHPLMPVYFGQEIAKQIAHARLAGLGVRKVPCRFGNRARRPTVRKRPAFISELPWNYGGDVETITQSHWRRLVKQMEVTLHNVRLLKGRVAKLKIGPPISKPQIEELEAIAGCRFPRDLCHILETYASHVDFAWYIDEVGALGRLGAFGVGAGLWDFRKLRARMKVFAQLTQAGCHEYSERIPIWEVGNGDYVALDGRPRSTTFHSVIYLDHERNAARHEKRVARGFSDYVMRIVHLGGLDIDYLVDSDFYDAKNRVIATSKRIVTEWRRILVGESWRP